MRYRRLPRLHESRRTAREIDADVAEEIAFHLQMRTEALMASGMAEEGARAQAEREFGDVDLARDRLRHRDERVQRRARAGMWLDDLRQDVRYALRSFSRARGFTAVALATLALGIGATVAIFTLVNTVLLRPLPYPTSDRLVQLAPGMNYNVVLSREVAQLPSLAAASGLANWDFALTGHGDAARVRAQAVGWQFFDVVGVQPALGRPFREDEGAPGTADVVILSWELWTTRFGGDPDIVGRTVRMDGNGYSQREVVGVMPRGFMPPVTSRPREIAAWVPLSARPAATVVSDSSWYVNQVIGLLQPGATTAAATAELRGTLARVRSASGNIIEPEVAEQASAVLLRESLVGDTRNTLLLLQGAVALVLLLACGNLANLLLARGDGRRQEFAARAALGGTRARLVRELLTEAGVLAAFGAAAGLLVSHALLQLLRVSDASGLPRVAELTLDVRVVLFAAAVAGASVLLFALPPALRATRGDLRPDLAAAGRAPGVTRSGRRFGAALIATEVAIALVLVTGAGLLLQSLRSLRAVDPGMEPTNVLAMEVSLPPAEYAGDRAGVFYDALTERLNALPGVQSVGAIQLLPFTPSNWAFPFLAEGHAAPSGSPLPVANFRITRPGYFETVGIPVLAGRSFDGSESRDGSDLVINRAMAEQLWPGQDAVGREIMLFGSMSARVIGVVGDVHQHSLEQRPEPEMYRPFAQWGQRSMYVMIRTGQQPHTVADAARRAVWALDPNVPVETRLLSEVLDESMTERRFFARALTFFGLLALVLGSVGVYGVMSYATTARLPEFGVRMALGASRGEVLRMALFSAMTPVVIGVAAGLAGALAANRLLQSLLFNVHPRDTATLAASVIVLVLASLLASWLPARRATHADPVRVLRHGG